MNSNDMFMIADHDKVIYYGPSFVSFFLTIIPLLVFLDNIWYNILSIFISSFVGITVNEIVCIIKRG